MRRQINLPVIEHPEVEKERIRKSKAGRWRAAALIALNVLMVVHIVQWRLTGETVTPIEPSEAMFTLQNGAVNAGFIFFSLAILATLVFGRFVCGWGCHILALQDLCAWMLKKVGLTPRPFRSRLLVYVPLIVALYMFVWPTVSRWMVKPAADPLIPQFTNHLITTEFWATFPPVWVAIPFLFVCGFMAVYFMGSKGFCTYGCPYGGFFGVADKVAPGRIRVTEDCNQCGHCTATCTSNVLVHAEVREYGMVVDPGCMKCMDCVSVCPTDALYFGFGKTAVGTRTNKVKKNYSLSWPEEIVAAAVFALSFFAVWDVYQLVPMLMALGIAIVTTFLAMRLLRLFKASDLSFYRWNLKSAGNISRAGWAFGAAAVLWIGFTAHSGWVRYLESAGSRAFASLQIPDELALARTEPETWLSSAERKNLAEGRSHLRTAADIGIFTNTFALPKLAWMEYLSGNTDQAVVLLERAAEHQSGQPKALSHYYRGAILNRTERPEPALASLDEALAERPDLVAAHEERGESLWRLNRREEAVSAWKRAVDLNPGLVVANNMLGAALSQTEAADSYIAQADRNTPADPLFHWMVALRLENVGMRELAEKHYQAAIRLNPQFRSRRTLDLLPKGLIK